MEGEGEHCLVEEEEQGQVVEFVVIGKKKVEVGL